MKTWMKSKLKAVFSTARFFLITFGLWDFDYNMPKWYEEK